jgi:hypothetical protein
LERIANTARQLIDEVESVDNVDTVTGRKAVA